MNPINMKLYLLTYPPLFILSLNLSHRVFSTPLDVLNVRLDYALKHVVGQITFTTNQHLSTYVLSHLY